MTGAVLIRRPLGSDHLRANCCAKEDLNKSVHENELEPARRPGRGDEWAPQTPDWKYLISGFIFGKVPCRLPGSCELKCDAAHLNARVCLGS